MQNIADWLQSLGLSDYAQSFADNDIDFSILGDLTDQDLEKLGVVSLGHRRKILRAIASLQTGETSAPAVSSVTSSPIPAFDAAERRQRDDRVELACFQKLAIEAALPLERLGDRVRRGSGEHRHGQHPRADDAEAEQQEGGITGQRA